MKWRHDQKGKIYYYSILARPRSEQKPRYPRKIGDTSRRLDQEKSLIYRLMIVGAFNVWLPIFFLLSKYLLMDFFNK